MWSNAARLCSGQSLGSRGYSWSTISRSRRESCHGPFLCPSLSCLFRDMWRKLGTRSLWRSSSPVICDGTVGESKGLIYWRHSEFSSGTILTIHRNGLIITAPFLWIRFFDSSSVCVTLLAPPSSGQYWIKTISVWMFRKETGTPALLLHLLFWPAMV